MVNALLNFHQIKKKLKLMSTFDSLVICWDLVSKSSNNFLFYSFILTMQLTLLQTFDHVTNLLLHFALGQSKSNELVKETFYCKT